MVAKPKSAAAKKAAGEQKNKAAAAAAVATSLDGSSVSVVRRQMSRRDTEKQVERALQSSHFRHISAVSLANKVVDGKTIRQSLTDVLHNLDKGQRLGTSTYATLARKFSDGESCVESLKPSVADLPVDDNLVQVLALMESDGSGSKSLKSLQAYLESTDEMNERNLIGLVRSTMSAKLLAKLNHEHVLLVVMKYFVRHVFSKSNVLSIHCLYFPGPLNCKHEFALHRFRFVLRISGLIVFGALASASQVFVCHIGV